MSLEVILVILLLVGFGTFVYLRKKKSDANKSNGSGQIGGGLPKDEGKQNLK